MKLKKYAKLEVIESFVNKAVDLASFFSPINFSSRIKTFNSIDALEDNFKIWRSNLNLWSIFIHNKFTVLVDLILS